MKSNCRSLSSRRTTNNGSRDKNILESPDWLPDGWTVEVKFRKSGLKEGAKYKCYIAPITGCKLYSMRDVERYLNVKRMSHLPTKLKEPPELEERCANMNSKDNVVVQRKGSINELPPGWIRETKVRRTGDRKDLYYTHPESEYVFRSKKDLFRYVEFGEVGRHAMKRKKHDPICVKVEEYTSPPCAAKRQKLKVRARGRRLFTEGLDTIGSKDEPVMPKCDDPFSSDASEQCGECTDLKSFTLLENKEDLEEKVAEIERTEKQAVSALALENGDEICKGRKSPSRKRRIKKYLDVPRRASGRLAALRAVHSQNFETGNQSHKVASVQQVSLNVDLPSSSTKSSHSPEPEKLGYLEFQPGVTTISHSSEAINIRKCEWSLGLEEQSSDYGMGNFSCEELPNGFEKVNNNQQHSDRFEGEEKVDGKHESQLIMPFGDSWPDPCLEFAFKTLTGAIPVEENLVIDDYLKQPLDLGSTQKADEHPQPGFVGDSICGTDLLSFDSLVKSSELPEMQWNPAFAASGNELNLNFSTTALQWTVEGKK